MRVFSERIRNFIFVRFFMFASLTLASRSDYFLDKLSLLAHTITRREHYKKKILWIRNLIRKKHPSLIVIKKILRDTDPDQRDRLVRSFILNQLLLGSNKRKRFSMQKGGFYPPGFMVISPSMKCNLKCYGCYAGSYDQNEALGFDDIDRVLNEGKEMGMYFAVISGGEPFMNKHLLDIFEKHSDVAFHVYTHGGLIDKKMADRIAKLGNILPAISLEGYRAETDKRRGQGHFKRVMEAMRLLKERKLLFGFSSTLTRENADLISSDEFIDFLIEQGCTVGWYFMYVPVGRAPDMAIMPTPEQRNSLRQRVNYIRNSKPILIGDFWNDGPVVGGCLAGGRKYFHINSKGDVEPCVFCHFAVDNIKNKSLKEALNSPVFQRIRQTIKDNPNLLRPCMIVDHPEVFREASAFDGVYFTHKGADKVVNELAHELDRFSFEYGKLADAAWESEYSNGKK